MGEEICLSSQYSRLGLLASALPPTAQSEGHKVIAAVTQASQLCCACPTHL